MLIAAMVVGIADAASARPAPSASPCHEVVFDVAAFTDCIAIPGQQTVRLRLDGPDGRPLRSLAALKAHRTAVDPPPAFAINGGMFDELGDPIGLYVEAGEIRHGLNRQSGPGTLHMLPNGVFSVERDGWHIRTSSAYSERSGPPPLFATQSGPMLLIGNKLHPSITENGPSRFIRNGVGIDRSGRAHFVISDNPVSFGKLARLFRDQLNCPDALYFDGNVLSLWAPAMGRLYQSAALGPLILVENSRKARQP